MPIDNTRHSALRVPVAIFTLMNNWHLSRVLRARKKRKNVTSAKFDNFIVFPVFLLRCRALWKFKTRRSLSVLLVTYELSSVVTTRKTYLAACPALPISETVSGQDRGRNGSAAPFVWKSVRCFCWQLSRPFSAVTIVTSVCYSDSCHFRLVQWFLMGTPVKNLGFPRRECQRVFF